MPIQLVEIHCIWKRQFKKNVYSCIIANLIGDPEPEIVGCSFGAEMKAFDLEGNEVFLTEFSSNITCFNIASVSKKESIELISGSLEGLIYVMDTKGNPIWSTELASPVICMEIGDLKDDNRDEIIVGLENQMLVGIDNEGISFLEFKAPEPIIDCAIGHFSNDDIGKIFVLLKSGKIINISNEGNSKLVFHLQNQPTCLTLSKIEGQPIMIIGDKFGFIDLINPNEEIIAEYKIGEKVSCLDNYIIPSDKKEKVLLATASKNKIILLNLNKGKIIDRIETTIKTISREPEPQVAPSESISESPKITLSDSELETTVIPTKKDLKSQNVRVLRGGQIVGGNYIFKVKVINDGKYNITDVNIHILSYPEESLSLSRVDGHPEASPDRAKFHKVSKGGGFVSPSFVFKPVKDCIKGTIHAVVNFINEVDKIVTIKAKPHDIRLICGLLKPKTISNEEFEDITEDLLTFKRVGEEFTFPFKADQLYQKLIFVLKSKNFAVINTEKQDLKDEFIGTIKGFAEGSFSKNSVGLKLTINGYKDEQKSTLKVDIFSEDEDMSPHIISEFENAIKPQSCPECEENLPPELVKKFLSGLAAYCEACGADLHETRE
ncbi:MAG: hypothetical protein ACFE91_14460 [Promethearchaeota archaeon]